MMMVEADVAFLIAGSQTRGTVVSPLGRWTRGADRTPNVTSVKDHLNNLRLWTPDENVLRALEGTCFHNLAQLHKHPYKFTHNNALLSAIISCYNKENRLFEFGGNRVLFGLEDVLYMIGLPVDGEAVNGLDGEDYPETCTKYLGKNGKDIEQYAATLRDLRPDQLVTNQRTGDYKARNTQMNQYVSQVIALQEEFKHVAFEQIDREYNAHVDALASLSSVCADLSSNQTILLGEIATPDFDPSL
ncbi:hypothetical protein Vadar_011778 [Vaccinium darrowii]|uniref:Uncharacterized protein n=1 Tax=Vaccinium darrowii TaxID=229202 RepID=A0ACB7XQ98_9ERIC|nr:hypothetical protein Vadar_011778 [Vaccinium darrowii]